jgi:hypothetical protein
MEAGNAHRGIGIRRRALLVAALAVSTAALGAGHAGAARAATTCAWGGNPVAPTGVFTIKPGLTNLPAPHALRFQATGTLSGSDPACSGRVTFQGQIDAGSTCLVASFEGTVAGLPGVATWWGKGSLDVPSHLYDSTGREVGEENAQIMTQGNLENASQCNTPEGFTGPAGFSSNIVLFGNRR